MKRIVFLLCVLGLISGCGKKNDVDVKIKSNTDSSAESVIENITESDAVIEMQADTAVESTISSDLGILMADKKGLLEENPQDIMLTIELKESNIDDLSALELYINDQKSDSAFNDSGLNGDAIEGDGIYTCIDAYRHTTCDKPLIYKVKYNELESNTVTLYAFDKVNDSDFDDADTIIEEIEKIDDSLMDNAYVNPAYRYSAINQVYDNAKYYLDSGKLVHLDKNSSSVTMQFDSGIWYVYQPNLEGVEEGGSESNIDIITLQSFYSSTDEAGSTPLTSNVFDNCAESIADTFDNCRFVSNLDDSAVTLRALTELGENEIIIWNTHGGYSESIGGFSTLGESFSDAWNEGILSQADILMGSIVRTSGQRAAITNLFIDRYVGDLNNSLLYLGSCHSYQDLNYVISWYRNGLAAYVGFTDIVDSSYDRKVIEGLVQLMNKVNPDTEDYYTLREAEHVLYNEIGTDSHETRFRVIGDFQFASKKEKEPLVIKADGYYSSTHTGYENVGYFDYGDGQKYPGFYTAKIENGYLIFKGGFSYSSDGESSVDNTEFGEYKIPIADSCVIQFGDEGYDDFITEKEFNDSFGTTDKMLGRLLHITIENGKIVYLVNGA